MDRCAYPPLCAFCPRVRHSRRRLVRPSFVLRMASALSTFSVLLFLTMCMLWSAMLLLLAAVRLLFLAVLLCFLY